MSNDEYKLIELITPGKEYYQRLPGGRKQLIKTRYFWYKTELYILGVGGRLLVEWMLSALVVTVLGVYLSGGF